MSDTINTFIQQNRNAFDTGDPGMHGWKDLEKMLGRLPQADSLEQFVWCNRILLDTELPSQEVWNAIEQQIGLCRDSGNLEKFICENRSEFDHAIPDLSVWSGIAGALEHNTAAPKASIIPLSWHKYLARAAAAVALLIIGLGAGIWYGRSQASPGMAMADVSPEYAELEQYYQRDISNKKEKLASFTGSRSADVYQDLDQLDQIMSDLRRDLADVPPGNRRQVVRAMIENYKAKAAILQRVLDHLEETQTEGNNSKLKNEIKNM